MIVSYDAGVDALTIKLLPDASLSKTVEIDEARHVDLDQFGQVANIEILWASEGFVLHDIIDRFDLYEMKEDLESVMNMTFTRTEFRLDA